MQRGNLSRRGFVARSLAGMAATGLPTWFAQEAVAQQQAAQAQAQANVAANDRLVFAAIGTGTDRFRQANHQPTRGERGIAIMRDAMSKPGVQMIAVCDVDRHNAAYAANLVGQNTKQFEDYKVLLQDNSIDCVTIGTPDHWHAAVAIAAMKAGKHVYCEKPLTLTLEEGKAMVRVQRETGKTLQTGSQQRSDARFRLACELVRNGRIGRVNKITTLIGDNPVGGPFPAQQVPEGLNWDFWLGPTPLVPFTKNRCHYQFRWWYDYSGGKMTDWGAHHNDIAQWALGMDESGPSQVYCASATPAANDGRSYNCHQDFEVVYTYNNGANGGPGTKLHCKSRPPMQGWPHPSNGILFEGEGGKWIFVNRGSISASQQALLDEPLPQTATRLEVSLNHMANFLEGVRSRKQPICHVGVGHRSCSVCHLGAIALRLGRGQDRALTWNPLEERFMGNEAEANAMLTRAYREPYVLGA